MTRRVINEYTCSTVLIVLTVLTVDVRCQYGQQQHYGMPQQQQAMPQSYQQGQVYHQQGGQQQVQYQQVPVQYQQVPVQHQQIPGQVPHYQQVPQPGSNVLHDASRIHDKEHIKEHLHGVINDPDLSKMTEEELQFHYFKMHDNDNNNKLDGSELIKSLIHWHVEESKHLGANAPPTGTTKVFTDQELSNMIDPILEMDDKNRDGYIDYPEFIAAQKSRGL